MKKRWAALLLALVLVCVTALSAMPALAASRTDSIRVRGTSSSVRIYKNDKLSKTVSVRGDADVDLYKSSNGQYVVRFVDSKGSTRSFGVGKNVEFTLSGDFSFVDVGSSLGSTAVAVSSTGDIEYLGVDSRSQVNVYGQVESIEVGNKATINLRKGADVDTLTLGVSGSTGQVYKGARVDLVERADGASVRKSSGAYIGNVVNLDDDDVVEILPTAAPWPTPWPTATPRPTPAPTPTAPKVVGCYLRGTPIVGTTLVAEPQFSTYNSYYYNGQVAYEWYAVRSWSGWNDEFLGYGKNLTLTDAMLGKQIYCKAAGYGSITGSAVSVPTSSVVGDTTSVTNKVNLGSGSLGVAGNGTITGLTKGAKYYVKAESGTNLKRVAFHPVNSDGTLADSVSEKEAKTGVDSGALTGEAIIELQNGTGVRYTVYKIELIPKVTKATFTSAGDTTETEAVINGNDITIASSDFKNTVLKFTVENATKAVLTMVNISYKATLSNGVMQIDAAEYAATQIWELELTGPDATTKTYKVKFEAKTP